jgi:uncharacterized membrane protein
MLINRYLLGVLVAALFVSLLANIFYGGILVGHAAKPLPSTAEVVSLGPILKSLPEADRRMMRRNFGMHKDEIRQATDAAKHSAVVLREALAATPYDQAKLDAALADYQRDFHALHALEQNVFWDGVQHMSPAGRKQLADSPAFERMAVK